jgi:16S rRNA G527 N7-methylase RsmG
MSLARALEWSGIEPTTELLTRFEIYREWLGTEAVAAGGLGPDEATRLEERHLGDSVLFAGVWDRGLSQPVLDVGTGVGLPGIPLALTHPRRRFVLLDRSSRRIGLARRAVRILGLGNVELVETDIDAYDWRGHTVVSRASLSPAALRARAQRRGEPAELLVAGSHRERPDVAGYQTMEVPGDILDRTVWILRMAQS